MSTPRDERRSEFEGLLMPTLDTAFRLAMRLARNREDAGDLVQDASLQAFRAFHTFQSGTNFRAWFLKILTNLYYKNRSRTANRPEATGIDSTPELYLYNQSKKLGLLDGSADPGATVIEKLGVEDVTAAIDKLQDEFRDVCALYFLDDLSYEEIATVLEIPIGTVRSRLHRGRNLLQRALWDVAVEQGVVHAAEGING